MIIQPTDLRIDRYSSTVRSGFSVRPIDGIRITHIPTGVIVTSEGERSAHKNRIVAMSLLRTKLYEHEQQSKKASELLLESATPFDRACVKVKELEEQLQEISNILQYPNQWDTMAYPTLLDAIKEIYPYYTQG